jgi:hypothetical protein
MKEFRAGMMSAASKALSSSRGFGKYTSINPKSGYVEFRSAGGEDYFGDIPLLKNTLMRYAYALSIAGDPAAEKKEYSKKMYKLLTNVQTRKTTDPKGGRTRTEPVQDVSKDAIALFSSYMSGEMPKSSLKNYIKQIQNRREVAKNPPKEKIQWQVRHPNGAAMITVMATSSEEAIQIAKKEYNDQRNPDDAYSAIPVLISPPEILSATPLRVRTTVGEPRPAFTEPRSNSIPEVPLDIAQNFQEPPASWDGGPPIQTEPQNFPAARSPATGGEFTGLWRVVSGATGEALHTFVFRSNDQTVADRVAADWARRTGFDDPVQATPVYRTPGTRT